MINLTQIYDKFRKKHIYHKSAKFIINLTQIYHKSASKFMIKMFFSKFIVNLSPFYHKFRKRGF